MTFCLKRCLEKHSKSYLIIIITSKELTRKGIWLRAEAVAAVGFLSIVANGRNFNSSKIEATCEAVGGRQTCGLTVVTQRRPPQP